MDTSEKYIKMCDCPEIQRQKYFYEHGFRGNFFNGDIRLPRQDQIQEMISEKLFAGLFVFEDVDIGARLSYMVERFKDFVQVKCEKMIPLEKNRARVEYLFLSMEQLWLAFYMHEKHSKIWLSKEEKWVKK